MVADKAFWTDRDAAGHIDTLKAICIRATDRFILAIGFRYASDRVVWSGNTQKAEINTVHDIQIKPDETLLGLEVGFCIWEGKNVGNDICLVGDIYVSTSQTHIIHPCVFEMAFWLITLKLVPPSIHPRTT
jgi:hypothetical protein